jgi:hypothetical protein
MTELVLQTPEVFKPLDQPSRYKGAYGGRGSGKSWHFTSQPEQEHLDTRFAVPEATLQQGAWDIAKIIADEW